MTNVALTLAELGLHSLYVGFLLPAMGYSFLTAFGGSWFSGMNARKHLIFSMLLGIYIETGLGIALGLIGLLNQPILFSSEAALLVSFAFLGHCISRNDNPFSNMLRIWKSQQHRFEISSILLLALGSALFTLPFGVYSNDTLRMLIVTKAIVNGNSINFGGGILGLTEIDPFASAIGAPLFTATLSLHGLSYSVSNSYLVGSILLSFLIGLSVYELLSYWFRSDSMSNHDRKWLILLLAASYVFSEVVVKWTGWAVTGRTFIFLLIPTTILLLISRNEENITTTSVLGYAIMATINFIFHQILAFTFFIALIHGVLVRSKTELLRSTRVIRITTTIILIEMIIPFALYAFGETVLVWPWMIQRDLYVILDPLNIPLGPSPIGTLGTLLSFLIWFGIRLGWLLPLSVLGYFGILGDFDNLRIEQKRLAVLSSLCVIPIVLFLFREMYFYQVALPFILIFACGIGNGLKRVYSRFSIIFNSVPPWFEWIKSPGQWFLSRTELEKMFVLMIMILPTTVLESYRVLAIRNDLSDRRYISTDCVEVANFLDSREIGDVVITDYHLTSYKINILLDIPTLPTARRLLRIYGFDTSPLTVNWPSSSFESIYVFIRRPLEIQYQPEIERDLDYILRNPPNSTEVKEFLMKYGIHFVILTNERTKSREFYISLKDEYAPVFSNDEFSVYEFNTLS